MIPTFVFNYHYIQIRRTFIDDAVVHASNANLFIYLQNTCSVEITNNKNKSCFIGVEFVTVILSAQIPEITGRCGRLRRAMNRDSKGQGFRPLTFRACTG